MLKPVLALVVLIPLAIVPVLRLFPSGQDALSERTGELFGGGGTIGYRFILWELAAAAYLNHPVTGIGSGGFARQQNALYFQINDAFTSEYEKEYGTLSTHNTVLGVAAETGTLGLIAYFLWVTAVAKVALGAIKIEKLFPDIYILAASACLLALMLEDWWGQASFMAPFTCLLGLILGWCRSQRAAEQRVALAIAR
jgi:O-antigen ligase